MIFSLIYADLWHTLVLVYREWQLIVFNFRVRSFETTLGVYLFSTEARGTCFGNYFAARGKMRWPGHGRTVQYNPFDLSIRNIDILAFFKKKLFYPELFNEGVYSSSVTKSFWLGVLNRWKDDKPKWLDCCVYEDGCLSKT